MTLSESQSGSGAHFEEVLTLGEAAAYLRVSETELAELADKNGIPARKVAGEWRFLRRGLNYWLVSRERHPRDIWMHDPHFLLDSPFAEELLFMLEQRLLRKLKQEPPEPKPGSKQAVLQRFGVFRDDSDLEEQLDAIRKRREAGG